MRLMVVRSPNSACRPERPSLARVLLVTDGGDTLSLYRRIRRPVGKFRRRIKRAWWDRLTGKQYRRWLAQAQEIEPSSIDNVVPITIIMAVYNPPVPFLRACVQSVRSQSARNWQFVISDDGSTDPDVAALLDEVERSLDQRIIVLRAANGGISAAQNRALEQVTTEFFGWMDHDDLLDPRAVAAMSEAIATAPGSVEVVYSDEDKIDGSGRHFDLYCKPDFSPELLLTQMYLCHFTVFRTSLVRRVGGFRSEMDGAQDFDLALRISDQLSAANVVHVSLPLYHWRAWENSTARAIDAKPWAQEATARAQRDHLARSGFGGTVQPSSIPGLNEVHPGIAQMPPISVIIPTAGTRSDSGERFIDRVVASLRHRTDESEIEIVAVTTNEISPIANVDKQIVYETDDFNFAAAINMGRAYASHDVLLLLNDDTELVAPDSLERMVEILQQPGVGIVGAKLSYPSGRLQHVGMILLPTGPTHARIGKPAADPGYFGSTLTPRNFSSVTAAAMMTSGGVFDALGGFDESFAKDFNDVDFCLRAGEMGHRVAWTPYAHFIHHEGVSIVRRRPDTREWERFATRWAKRLERDPFYSPSLHASIERLYEPL